jgi:hypothetical protein
MVPVQTRDGWIAVEHIAPKNQDQIVGACALAAAAIAVHGPEALLEAANDQSVSLDPTFSVGQKMFQLFPWLDDEVISVLKVPDGLIVVPEDKSQDAGAVRLADIIIALNDNATWTRERIADWLESIGK